MREGLIFDPRKQKPWRKNFLHAFDGTSIWVANAGSDNVTKRRVSDGALLGTFTVGDNPLEIAFDGTNVWITNFAGETVSRLLASDGSSRGTFTVGNFPNGVVFD